MACNVITRQQAQDQAGNVQFFELDEEKRIHGEAKRVILKKSLQAILPSVFYCGVQNLVYNDGFSGEGAYQFTQGDVQTKDTPVEKYGSPVIALHCTLDCFKNITENLEKHRGDERGFVILIGQVQRSICAISTVIHALLPRV